MSIITVLGASGFIGSHLVRALTERRIAHQAPGRDEILSDGPLGHVIYAIGLTADFRSRPFETVEAHVCLLRRILQECRFDSLTYLSSTRVYGTHSRVADEEDELRVSPSNPSDLYNISKAMGESLCLTCTANARVVRISNVYGADFASDNFLSSVIREAVSTGKVVLRSAPASEKDYVSISDVTDALLAIAARGQRRIYNLASGRNTSNAALLAEISRVSGCRTEVAPGSPTMTFPVISVQRLKDEFAFSPGNVLAEVPELISAYQQYQERSA